jgi:hypothetical protein
MDRVRIVFFILNMYLPGWFQIKSRPYILDGSRNFQFLLDLSRDLCEDDQQIVQRVMQDNSHWAHPENVILSCLGDSREEVRRKGVLYVMKARREFDAESHPRQFFPPRINFMVRTLDDG